MKFPRSNKIIPGQLDVAAFAGVLFLLLMFIALTRDLVFTPGVSIRLPEAVDLSGVSGPTVAVAVDAGGQTYFDNQIITEPELRRRLLEQARRSKEPLTLVLQADEQVKHQTIVRLALLARETGITNALLATRPPGLRPSETGP